MPAASQRAPSGKRRARYILPFLFALGCERVIVLGDLTTVPEPNPMVTPDAGPIGDPGPIGDAAPTGTGECITLYGDALACTGFETANSYTAIVDATEEATVSLSSVQAHSGESAVHCTTNAAGSWASTLYPFAPISSGTIHLRAYFFVPAGSITGRINVITVEAAEILNIDVNFNSDLEVEAFFHSDGSRYQSSASVIPEGQWFCLQTAVQVHDSAGAVEVWLDGQPQLATPADKDTLPDTGIAEAELGISWTEAGQTVAELFVDDVVIDTNPVPCQ